MNRYTLYCTETQTRKALELGAPIEKVDTKDKRMIYYGHLCYPKTEADYPYAIPTTEQMCCFLEEQKSITIEVSRQYGINKYCYYIFDNYGNDIESIESKIRFSSRKETVLAAVDVALEYLMDNKK